MKVKAKCNIKHGSRWITQGEVLDIPDARLAEYRGLVDVVETPVHAPEVPKAPEIPTVPETASAPEAPDAPGEAKTPEQAEGTETEKPVRSRTTRSRKAKAE